VLRKSINFFNYLLITFWAVHPGELLLPSSLIKDTKLGLVSGIEGVWNSVQKELDGVEHYEWDKMYECRR